MNTDVNIASSLLGRRRRSARLSLTPLIDVVFILLIFFMLESDFLKPFAMDVAAPGGATSAQQSTAPLNIELQSNGSLWLNRVEYGLDDFRATVARLNPAPETPVVLSADDGVALQRAVDVLDILQARGLTNIALQEAQQFDRP